MKQNAVAQARMMSNSPMSSNSTGAGGGGVEGLTTLTYPAIVAIVGYAIMALVVLLPFDMYTYDERTNSYVRAPYRFWERLLIMILLLFPFFLGVYTINCMMVGDCHMWSWIVAAATLLWGCVVIITAITQRAFRLDDMVY